MRLDGRLKLAVALKRKPKSCTYCNGTGKGDWPERGGGCEACRGTGLEKDVGK
jgi:hypothetical protein